MVNLYGCTIGRETKVGAFVEIQKGAVVGALIGAGAVVTKDVPDYAIVAGVPARVLGDTREPRQRQSPCQRHSGIEESAEEDS